MKPKSYFSLGTINMAVACFALLMVGLLTALAKAERLTINTLEEPPSNFTNERGELTGISVDMVREIQKRVGNRDPIIVNPWARTYRNALKQPNVVAFTATRTTEREDKFHWIAKIARNKYQFYARKGSHIRIQSLEDAKKYSIGVLRGSVWESELRNNGFTNIDSATNHALNAKKLLRGRVDLIYFSSAGIFQVSKEAGVDFRELEPLFATGQIEAYIIMSKNGTPVETVDTWKQAAREIKADGTFFNIAQKWVAYLKNHDGFDAHFENGAINYWRREASEP